VIISCVSITVLDIVLAIQLNIEYVDGQIVSDSVISIHNAWPWFILVCGICIPLQLKDMLSFGLTRVQFATGLIWAGTLITAGFAALDSIMYVVIGYQITPANLLSDFLIAFSFWLFGWLVTVGFQYRNFFTSAGGIALSVFLIYALIRFAYVEQALGGWHESSAFFELSMPGVAVFVIVNVLLTAALRFLTKRIPVSC
jgi:hypothetical protein